MSVSSVVLEFHISHKQQTWSTESKTPAILCVYVCIWCVQAEVKIICVLNKTYLNITIFIPVRMSWQILIRPGGGFSVRIKTRGKKPPVTKQKDTDSQQELFLHYYTSRLLQTNSRCKFSSRLLPGKLSPSKWRQATPLRMSSLRFKTRKAFPQTSRDSSSLGNS